MVGWFEQTPEIATNHYYDPKRSAGEEVSSTFEGRHIYVQESLLTHVDNGDGLVDKGQPVAFWEGVGVALKSATSASENIPIDTEGVWRLSVVATVSVAVGQSLYITTSGVVTDDPSNAQAVIGYALQQITSPGTAIIAVKVHWMGVPWIWFWWYFYQSFQT